MTIDRWNCTSYCLCESRKGHFEKASDDGVWVLYEEHRATVANLRGNLSLAEEGLANYAQEVQRLQRALAFWLPCVPAHELPPDIEKRLEDDIAILAGYDGPVEPEAETLGWIELCIPAQIRELCPECLGYMPCAQHPRGDGN